VVELFVLYIVVAVIPPVEDALARLVCPAIVTLPEAERLVVEALASVLCPVTARVPFDVSDVVKTASVARRSEVKNDPVEVAFVNDDDTAVKNEAKRFDDVAFVVEALTAAKLLVAVALVKVNEVKSPVLPLSVVIVEEEDVRSVMVAEEMVVVANDDVPVAVTVVKTGVRDTLIVEVPVKVILSPAVKPPTGLVSKVFHAVVEAVSGIV
jgi:hypothetical protein